MKTFVLLSQGVVWHFYLFKFLLRISVWILNFLDSFLARQLITKVANSKHVTVLFWGYSWITDTNSIFRKKYFDSEISHKTIKMSKCYILLFLSQYYLFIDENQFLFHSRFFHSKLLRILRFCLWSEGMDNTDIIPDRPKRVTHTDIRHRKFSVRVRESKLTA